MTLRLRQADAELVGFFTTAVGLQAQSYEPQFGIARDAHKAIIARIAQNALRSIDRVSKTLARLPFAQREVLEIVYGRGAGSFERGAKEVALDVDLLVRALAPRWGHGSFMRLVRRLPRAVRAHERRRDRLTTERDELRAKVMKLEADLKLQPRDVELSVRISVERRHYMERCRLAAESLPDFLRREAQPERAKETKGFFAQLVSECEQLRTPALEAYDVLRVQRIEDDRALRRTPPPAPAPPSHLELVLSGEEAA